MVRLREAAAAVALLTGGAGCVVFCDECHEFPAPGRYAMTTTGSYGGPPIRDVEGLGPAPAASPTTYGEAAPSQGPPSGGTPTQEAAPEPPPPPPEAGATTPFTPTPPTPPEGLPELP